jgi:CheY-like chemotaxis protein
MSSVLLSDPLATVGVFMLGASGGAFLMYIKYRQFFGIRHKTLPAEPASTPAPAGSKSHLGLKALIVGHDPEGTSVFSHVLRERGIEIQKCFSEAAALEQLASAKFQAVIVDSDEIDCAGMLKNLPRPNERVLVVAIASQSNKAAVTGAGISFVIERPLTAEQVREVLRVAYGPILRDGQQYFRLTAELPVSIRKASGAVLRGMTLNVSQTGMAVKSESSFTAGEPVNIAFAVPNTDIVVSAEGKIIWDDKHGKTGISFQCDSSSAQSRYHEWLHDHFFMMQSDVFPLQESEQAQERYVDQPFIRKIFKVPNLAYLHNRRDRLRRSRTIRDTDESRSLWGSSGGRHDGRTYRGGSDDPSSFN